MKKEDKENKKQSKEITNTPIKSPPVPLLHSTPLDKTDQVKQADQGNELQATNVKLKGKGCKCLIQ